MKTAYAYTKAWRKRNPEKAAAQKRRNQIKRRYGISVLDYEKLFNKQNGKCVVCMKTSTRRLDVDHDHSTGRVRGLLCNSCNQGLGSLKDNPLIVKAALEYLVGGVK